MPRTPPRSAFTRRELALIDRLRTPLQVQRYLRSLPYNWEPDGKTLRTFRGVVEHGTAHCLEAVLFAATVLEQHGYPTTVLDIESQDGLDHVVFLYDKGNRWGAVASSRDWGLHGRRPVFRSIPSLVQSYMDPFVDGSGRVVRFGIVNLDDIVRADWRLASHHVLSVERALIAMPHRRLGMPQARFERMLRRFQAFKASGAPFNRRTMRALYGPQVDRWL